MAANIFGERFLGHREPAWHKLGTVFTSPIGALEAIEAAGLDYIVKKAPLFIKPNGKHIELPDKVALVREPTPDDNEHRVFGYVHPRYGVMQNTEIGATLNPLTEQWPVETAGALGHGETIFLSLDAGMADVKGEEVHQFFLFTDSKTGKKAAQFMFTPVRVVCQNTLIAGTNSAVLSASLRHHENVAEELEWRTDLLLALQQAQSSVMGELNAMADAKLSMKLAKKIFAASFPMPKQPAILSMAAQGSDDIPALSIAVTDAQKWLKMVTKQMTESREAAMTLFTKFNDEHTATAMTAWGAYNAVVELQDYRGKETEKNLAASLFGYRAKAKKLAYNAAMAVVR